jgi:GNAT superfamily N-acetyltransferase
MGQQVGSVRLRAIAPTDGDSYRSILRRTTEEDRYCRFFHIVNHFDPEFIERYVGDQADVVGVIAEDEGRPLGVAHAFFFDERRAELAIVVARDSRRQGIGRALLEHLTAAIEARGCDELIAYSLGENVAFSRLARSVAMRPVATEAGVVTWEKR